MVEPFVLPEQNRRVLQRRITDTSEPMEVREEMEKARRRGVCHHPLSMRTQSNPDKIEGPDDFEYCRVCNVVTEQ